MDRNEFWMSARILISELISIWAFITGVRYFSLQHGIGRTFPQMDSLSEFPELVRSQNVRGGQQIGENTVSKVCELCLNELYTLKNYFKSLFNFG